MSTEKRPRKVSHALRPRAPTRVGRGTPARRVTLRLGLAVAHVIDAEELMVDEALDEVEAAPAGKQHADVQAPRRRSPNSRKHPPAALARVPTRPTCRDCSRPESARVSGSTAC